MKSLTASLFSGSTSLYLLSLYCHSDMSGCHRGGFLSPGKSEKKREKRAQGERTKYGNTTLKQLVLNECLVKHPFSCNDLESSN